MMANDLFNHLLVFLFFPHGPGSSEIVNALIKGFLTCSYFWGSWVCILICGTIALISHFRFRSVFINPIMKNAFFAIIGAYMLVFSVESIFFTAKIFATNGAQITFGEEGIGYALLQMMTGIPLTIFTVVYLISFLLRLIKNGKQRRMAIKEEETCKLSK